VCFLAVLGARVRHERANNEGLHSIVPGSITIPQRATATLTCERFWQRNCRANASRLLLRLLGSKFRRAGPRGALMF